MESAVSGQVQVKGTGTGQGLWQNFSMPDCTRGLMLRVGGGQPSHPSSLPSFVSHLLEAEEVEDVFACVDHRAQASTGRLGLGWTCREAELLNGSILYSP